MSEIAGPARGPRLFFRPPAPPSALALSPDGARLACGTFGGPVLIYRLEALSGEDGAGGKNGGRRGGDGGAVEGRE